MQSHFSFLFFFFFFFAVVGVELWALCLLGRHSTTWATLQPFVNFLSYWNVIQKVVAYVLCSRAFPMFSSSSFKVSGITLRCLIHFELILVQGERQGSSFSLLRVDIPLSQHHLLKTLSFFQCVLLATGEWIYFWVL
jgi:hypothetical protein